jgi:hypothetical protein
MRPKGIHTRESDHSGKEQLLVAIRFAPAPTVYYRNTMPGISFKVGLRVPPDAGLAGQSGDAAIPCGSTRRVRAHVRLVARADGVGQGNSRRLVELPVKYLLD